MERTDRFNPPLIRQAILGGSVAGLAHSTATMLQEREKAKEALPPSSVPAVESSPSAESALTAGEELSETQLEALLVATEDEVDSVLVPVEEEEKKKTGWRASLRRWI